MDKNRLEKLIKKIFKNILDDYYQIDNIEFLENYDLDNINERWENKQHTIIISLKKIGEYRYKSAQEILPHQYMSQPDDASNLENYIENWFGWNVIIDFV